VDLELILDSAEIVTPGLTDIARRILTATARDMDLSLELADVLARRAEGQPEVYITAAADELLTHLLDTGEDVLAHEEGVFTTLAIIARAELEGLAADLCKCPFRIKGNTL
jgi:hypothetical protein